MFDKVAGNVCEHLLSCCADADALLERFAGDIWANVRQGLENEWEDGRFDLNLTRVSNEMAALLAWGRRGGRQTPQERLLVVVSSYLHMIALGHLDEGVMRWLFDETPVSARGASCSTARVTRGMRVGFRCVSAMPSCCQADRATGSVLCAAPRRCPVLQ